MIRFTNMSSEHKLLPNRLLLSSEMSERNRRSSMYRDDSTNAYNEYSYDCYCTYAWIETDELDNTNEEPVEIPVAVMDYRPKYSKRTEFVFEEPLWSWIETERTEEQQKWISKNIDKLNDIFIAFAHIE